ncbi:MAG: CHRD domain-containing protein [Pseudomonadota bacterium]
MRAAVAILILASAAHAQEVPPVSRIALDPSRGAEIGDVYQAWLSPHQQGGEEEDTPGLVPSQFRSTEESVPRAERTSRGHGTLAFTRDLSKAYVHLKIENVVPSEINMFHIHCGRPGQLGPILVDFGLVGEVATFFADGEVSLEIDNALIVATSAADNGLVDAFTSGCPIIPLIPTDKVKTVAGMAQIAAERELYFNLHTTRQTYFGDIRGQLYPVE